MPATTEQGLEDLATELEKARAPISIFGTLDGEAEQQLSSARKIYRRLARICHPDTADGDRDLANRAFERLNSLWERAQRQIETGTYGTSAGDALGLKILGKRHRYTVDRLIANGDIADVYACKIDDGRDGVLKLARKPSSASFIQTEASRLRHLGDEVDDAYKPYFPELIETLRCRGRGGIHRLANVTATVDGLYSLEEVMAIRGRRMDPRDMAWIWRRLLTAMGAAHKAGIVHGALLPPHVLIHPAMHGVVLVGWGTSLKRGDQQRTISSAYKLWYPNEVFDHKGVTEETDIFMGACCMTYLLGANVVPNHHTPKAMRAFFRGCTLPKQNMRPDDAWALKETFDEVLERLYGPRRFRPFDMPTR